MRYYKLQRNRGSGLIEIIIGLAVIFTAFFSALTAYIFFIQVSIKNADVTKSNFLLEETVEVVRYLRDSNWTSFSGLATSTTYFLDFDGVSWNATSTNNYIDDKFERSFVVYTVFRDGNGDISAIGTEDESIRKIEASVSWFVSGATSTQSAETYLANLFE